MQYHDYEKMSVKELKEEAKAKNITGVSSLHKHDLIRRLLTSPKRIVQRTVSVPKKLVSPKKSQTKLLTCKKQTSKKYTSRDSPPYSATACCYKVREGNDGHLYVSEPSKLGKSDCKWRLL